MGMSTNSSGRRNQGIEGINVTPMVDIMLVLLVIYIVASEMGQGQVPIELPTDAQSAPAIDKAPLRIVMQEHGELSFEGQPISSRALQDRLSSLSIEQKKTVLLQADKRVPHGKVVELMRLLSATGVKDLSFATTLK